VKLLADLPAVDVEEPPHRPKLAIMGGIAVLVLMLGVGLALVFSADNPPEEPAALAPAETGPADAGGLADWVDGASDACRTTAAEHATFVDSGDVSLGELDLAVRSLAVAIRDVPLPPDRDTRAQILPVVLLGDEAEQAWYGISGLERDDVSRDELAYADGLARAFLTGLVDIGADCSALS
jgi:hypothetical protein